MRLAAIDIGTNSCRLLVAQIDNNKIVPVCAKVETTRLGESVMSAGILNEAAIERTIGCVVNFKDLIDKYQVKSIQAVATSAVREAGNSSDFAARLLSKTGIEVKIIDGREEARLSYLGVINGLELKTLPMVVDLGGGSTEFILQTDEFTAMSIPIGAVKAAESRMSAVDISVELKSAMLSYRDKIKDTPLVFAGGTATSLVAVKLSLEVYKRELVHGQVLSRREVADLYNMLERMPLNLRKRIPGLQPERADVIHKGALIMLIIMDLLEKEEVIVSDSDLLEGLIWEAI